MTGEEILVDPAAEWIRHLAGTDGMLFASAWFTKDVFVWDAGIGRLRMHLTTGLDFGGRRLAVLEGDPPMVLTGAFSRYGVEAYDLTAGGLKVWQRPDLKKVQRLEVCPLTRRVAVSLERGGCRILGASTGQTLFRPLGYRETAFAGRQEAIVCRREHQLFYVSLPFLKREGEFDLRGLTPDRWQGFEPGLLVANWFRRGFGPVVGDENDPDVMELSFHNWSGRRMWSRAVAPTSACVAMGYDPGRNLLFAVSHSFADDRTTRLIEIEPSGQNLRVRELPVSSSEWAFLDQGRRLAGGSGVVLETETLAESWRFVKPPPG